MMVVSVGPLGRRSRKLGVEGGGGVVWVGCCGCVGCGCVSGLWVCVGDG
jgi:hypothetical protein